MSKELPEGLRPKRYAPGRAGRLAQAKDTLVALSKPGCRTPWVLISHDPGDLTCLLGTVRSVEEATHLAAAAVYQMQEVAKQSGDAHMAGTAEAILAILTDRVDVIGGGVQARPAP